LSHDVPNNDRFAYRHSTPQRRIVRSGATMSDRRFKGITSLIGRAARRRARSASLAATALVALVACQDGIIGERPAGFHPSGSGIDPTGGGDPGAGGSAGSTGSGGSSGSGSTGSGGTTGPGGAGGGSTDGGTAAATLPAR